MGIGIDPLSGWPWACYCLPIRSTLTLGMIQSLLLTNCYICKTGTSQRLENEIRNVTGLETRLCLHGRFGTMQLMALLKCSRCQLK